MTTFKKSYLTTEFLGTCLLFIAACLFHNLMALTIIVSAYSIARGLHKKNRGILLYGAEKTTELYLTAAGIVAATFLFGNDPHFLYSAIMWAAFTISRGHTKSLTAQKINVTNL